MKTFTETLYVHKTPKYNDKEYTALTSDMSDHGYILLGTVEVEIPIPNTDLVQAEIKALENKAGKIQQETDAQLHMINQRINELKCIEYKQEGE